MRSMTLGTAVLAVVSISVPAYSDEGIFPGGRWWGEPLSESLCDGSVLGPLIEIDASPTGCCGSSGPCAESGVGHQLGRDAGGKVFAWGANSFGQTSVPSDLPSCIAVAAGYDHSVALTQTGVVRCWGDNTYNQCTVPRGLRGVKAVTAGKHFTVALRSDDTAVVWGTAADNIRNPPSVTMTQIDAGVSHVVARRTTGVAVCWGNNVSGQCNVPSTVGQVTQVRAGSSHSVALRTDHTVRCWGSNNSGESSVPAGLNQVTGIAAGRGFTLALQASGAVVAWGNPEFSVPSNLPPAIKIVASGCSAFAFVSPTTDCNQDGIEDDCQLGGNDCDQDGILDTCQLAGNDCDGNGVYDPCQLAAGDCDQDGILDACQLTGNDCDRDGVYDPCQLADGDCDTNGVLDVCETPLQFNDACARTPVDLIFICDPSGSMDEDLENFCSHVLPLMRSGLSATVDARVIWIGLAIPVPCSGADATFAMQSQIPVPCSTRAFDTGGSKGQGEDWADACSVAIYPGQGLFDPRWQPRPGVTIVLPMSDEGPNLGNGCSEWELPEAQAAVDDLISHANRWAAAVLPLAFPRDSPDVYSCVYETEGGVPSGWMQELARDTFPGGNAVDARNLNSGDPGTYGAIAAALVTEISRAVQVSPRRRVCGADFNGDGQVDAQDMAALLNAWGTSAASFDLNCNGTVDAPDMAALLNAWGPCPQ